MRAFGAVAARPRAGAQLGRWLTELNHGLLRSAVTGQANAVLVARELEAREEGTLVISESGERRVCQAVRVGGVGVVGNFHATGGPSADEQCRRAVDFVASADTCALVPRHPNLRPGEGAIHHHLPSPRFSAPLPGSLDPTPLRRPPPTPP